MHPRSEPQRPDAIAISPRARLALSLVAATLLSSCRAAPPASQPSGPSGVAAAAPAATGVVTAPSGATGSEERFHLGTHSRRITTGSGEAQRAFDRGLVLSYAFNHGAAEREFRKAVELDPRAAMPWWGVALVNGPHINNATVSPEAARTAWEALGKARALEASGSPVERALIAALGKRYVEPPAAAADGAATAAEPPEPPDRRPLDEAYAAAMRELWRAHPEDADIAALFAESMMDLRPWDNWTPDGKPQPGTEEVRATLERALELDPRHPLANHLYIHLMEGSKEPARAVPAADRLRALVPGAGHLVHMPGHIDVRVGRWQDAAVANERAIEADAAFRKATGEETPGFYTIYMVHNHHFLTFVAMMEGRRGAALAAAADVATRLPPEFLKETALFADGFMPIRLETLLRFGRWEEVLEEPEPADYLPVSRAIRLFARSAALNALGRTDEAERERKAFQQARAAMKDEAIKGNNTATDILAVAALVLDGEIAARAGRHDEAIKSLREAVRREDLLRYDEPPDWLQPVRHTLGAVLLRAGRGAEAEQAYREDLEKFPENGWSLLGLTQALRMQKKDAEAAAADERFKKAWARADTPITATCLCLPPAGGAPASATP